MKTEDKDTLKKALDLLSNYKNEFAIAVEKSVLVIFDKDEGESWEEVFETKEDFFERFKDEEADCEGFSWRLWEDKHISEFGRMYHLIKLFEVSE